MTSTLVITNIKAVLDFYNKKQKEHVACRIDKTTNQSWQCFTSKEGSPKEDPYTVRRNNKTCTILA